MNFIYLFFITDKRKIALMQMAFFSVHSSLLVLLGSLACPVWSYYSNSKYLYNFDVFNLNTLLLASYSLNSLKLHGKEFTQLLLCNGIYRTTIKLLRIKLRMNEWMLAYAIVEFQDIFYVSSCW